MEAIDVEPSGKVHVSGRAHPGAVARFYLNDSFVASATAGADGHLAVTINEGVAPGKYRVRLDELASMDTMPDPDSPLWRIVTVAAWARLAWRRFDLPLTIDCI